MDGTRIQHDDDNYAARSKNLHADKVPLERSANLLPPSEAP